jgi:type IV pilus assembly protein PilW
MAQIVVCLYLHRVVTTMPFSHWNKTGGFSLLELMVSTLLGLVLTSGIVSLYLESARHYVVEEDTARIQENGRFAMNHLKRELMLVGFYGGHADVARMSAVAVSDDCVSSGNWVLDPSSPLEFINDFDSSLVTQEGTELDCLPARSIMPGTDVLSLKRTAGEATVDSGVFRDGSNAANDRQWYLEIANYGEKKSWFYSGNSGFPSGTVGVSSNIDFWEFYAQIYFIRRYSIVPGDAIPTLCLAMLTRDGMDSECLVEGVEDLQLEFGVDTSGDGVANTFVSQPNALDIERSVAARISILLRGLRVIAGYTNTQSYVLGKKFVAAKNDAYLRRVMTTTVQLRNVGRLLL